MNKIKTIDKDRNNIRRVKLKRGTVKFIPIRLLKRGKK